MKSFQEVLEKRVHGAKTAILDFYTVEKAAKVVLEDVFGKTGTRNVKVKKWNGSQLALSSKKSLWRSEIALNRQVLILSINRRLNKPVIEEIIIIQ
ncbi:MAG: hypothetical protein U9M90_01075 [Patescibacteria group bacterium]|nr:hypothetical protein [Patescibacteria group bacterium]